MTERPLPFMSEAHVARMNELLEGSAEVREACSQLPRTLTLVQRLSNGPGGDPVTYTMTFSDTVRFSLQDEPDADVVLVGDWKQMIRSARAAKQGRQVDPGMSFDGNADAMALIDPVFALARGVATVPTELPDI